MDVLGLLGMLLFIAGVIALAAGLTWVVVKYTPTKRPDQTVP
jgi:hypothetical protein